MIMKVNEDDFYTGFGTKGNNRQCWNLSTGSVV